MGESLTERHARSVGLALSGRAAAREAIRCGANVVLLSTVQYAPFVPLPPAVNYIVYGDSTAAQVTELYAAKRWGFPVRPSPHGCDGWSIAAAIFLCMSEWYRDALRRELGVSDDRLVLLPFYVDTEKWKPPEQKPPKLALPGIVDRRRLLA